MPSPLLSISHVRKSFDSIYALKNVSFSVGPGECVALVGENGAGKSTLMKILAGVWPSGSFDGDIQFDGEPLRLKTPLQARRKGISIIFQELCLFPELSVAENLFLTESFPYEGKPAQRLGEWVHWPTLYKKAALLFRKQGLELDPTAFVKNLSVAERQLVEIARAVHHDARLLILDEPTSALSLKEVEVLFRIVGELREKGVSIIYISHKLDEVRRVADRIVVLRDGESVGELNPKTCTEKEIIELMVGRHIEEVNRVHRTFPEAPILEVKGLNHSDSRGKELLKDINFKVKKGEVLGIAGLMGSGRSELLRSILGVLPGKRSGEVWLSGEKKDWGNIEEALDEGLAFVPEDRKKDGLFLWLAIDFNMSISFLSRFSGKWGFLDLFGERKFASHWTQALNVKYANLKQSVRNLSGGNQQKVLLAKMVSRSPRVLLLDEPTRGIDVGAKEEIYQTVRDLAAQGMSIVMVSSELPEILSLSDRVLVIRDGAVVKELDNRGLNQAAIMECAAGGIG